MMKIFKFSSVEVAVNKLNQIVKQDFDGERKLREEIARNGGIEMVRAKRPFDLGTTPNSSPLCSSFREVQLSVGRRTFRPLESAIEVCGVSHPYHVSLTDGKRVLDPTLGQFAKDMGTTFEHLVRDNPRLFLDGVFVGSTEEALSLGVKYR